MQPNLPVVATLAVLVAAPAFADVAIRERGGHWTEATIIVNATPAEIYAVATDYTNWRQVFSDIESVKVEKSGQQDGQVRFRSRALEHVVTVQFDNISDRMMRFKGIKGPPGGRAKGEYILDPLDGGVRTRITARLYMNVVGFPGLFVGEGTLRPMRQNKLRADLRDVARWAEARRPSS